MDVLAENGTRDSSVNARWWTEEKGEAHDALASVARHIRQVSTWRREAHSLHAEMYAGGPAAAGLINMPKMSFGYQASSLPDNVCRSVADTVLAKVFKHRPLPVASTSRGNWKNQKRARKMTQLIEGAFYQQRLFEKKFQMIGRDALVFGCGALMIDRDGKNLITERCHIWELFVDEWDARYGEPRNFYRIYTVDKGVLIQRYAKDKDGKVDEDIKAAIESAAAETPVYDDDGGSLAGHGDSTVDRVYIVRAWHLASGPDMGEESDGRHVLTMLGGSATLVDEPWEYDHPPIEFLNYCEPLSGFWGSGIVEQLEGYQSQINRMNEKLEEAHNLLGGAWVFTTNDSEITDTEICNGVGIQIKHKPGREPQIYNPQPVHPQTYQWRSELKSDAMNQSGVSAMSAQSEVPTHLKSGVAINAVDDIETERFIIFGRAYEACTIAVGKQIVERIKEIAKDFGDFETKVPMKGGILSLKWSDVSLDDYDLRVLSSSLLPTQIGQRLDKLNYLFENQLIDRSTFMRLLDAPDLAAEVDMETADRLNIDERLELMLDAEGTPDEIDNIYRMPTPYQNYRWAQKRAQQKVNRAEIDGAPDENLELLRRYITDCQALIDKETGATPNPEQANPQDVLPPPDMTQMPTTPAGQGPGPAMPVPPAMGPPPPLQ